MSDILQIGIYLALVVAVAIALERPFAALANRSPGQMECRLLRIAGADPAGEMPWQRYALAVLGFNFAGFLLLYGLLRLQDLLPLNPQGLPGLSPTLAFNTAISFVTNTNWQAYSGEATLSYLSQMAGLTTQNFLSAATGMAVAIAVARGLVRQEAGTIGNFWVDVTRVTLVLLLPLAIIVAIALVTTGVPQTLAPYALARTPDGDIQTLALGPAASQIAIKQLGTNGGGFFGVNSAHPFENPTPLSNLIECVAILGLPATMALAFGRLVGDRRQGFALFAAMALLFVAGLTALYTAESVAPPALAALPLDLSQGPMEGKEVRFGVAASSVWAAATTAASNGSVNAMHDSMMPLSGLVELVNVMLGEVIFGGVGAGLYGIILYVILAVFIAGLMIGRTPEYLGKKIEEQEVKLALVALLSMPFGILVLGATSLVVPAGAASIQEAGPHGLTELLYAYSSATGNNGSAFGGFAADTPYQDVVLGLAMLIGRYAFIVPLLAIAGSLAAKRGAPRTAASFPTHGPLFVGLLIGTIVIVGALTFFPVLALGPVADHLAMQAGQSF